MIDIERVLNELGEPYEEKSTYYLVHCPYHDDRHPDMKIYKNTQLCVCFSCNLKKPFREYVKDKNLNVFTGLDFTQHVQQKRKTPERIVVKYPKWYAMLEEDITGLGLTIEMIKEFNIGYCRIGFKNPVNHMCKDCYYYDKFETVRRWISSEDTCFFSKGRIMIPTEMDGVLYDIESRDISGFAAKKVLFPHRSKGSFTIFNYNNLDRNKPLYVVEGRKSCLRIWRDIDHNCTALFNNHVKSGQKELLEEFRHVILIPDCGDAGLKMIEDFNKLSIPTKEVIKLPEILLCKNCKHKFRGKEKMDICPNCKSEKVGYMDAFDFETDSLFNLIANSRKGIDFWLEKLGIITEVFVEKKR